MIAFLMVLIQIFIYTRSLSNDIQLIHRIFIIAPFTIYIGWISVATVANISALLVNLQWNAWGIAPENWAVLMIAIAIILAFCFSFFYDSIAAPLVIAWALWGIMHGQGGRIELVYILSLIGMCVILILSLRLLIVKYILVR
jgi:translocator protein